MTPLTVVDEWEDEPAEGESADDWPYPTRHTRSIANGELAERIRRALGVTDPLADVYVEEAIISGGYSEYTQEDDYETVVRVGDVSAEFWSWSGGLPALLKWLDEKAPVE